MKIVTIGGGEIGRPGFPIETLEIDQEIIRLTGKKNPKLLFLPTASGDSLGYIEVVNSYFGNKLGCVIDSLLLINKKISEEELEKKVLSTDIIYVGGGNTLKMLNLWKKVGLDKIFKTAMEKNIVLSGVSAGAVCWFKYACSDSRIMNNPNADYIRVAGLGFIDLTLCPHFDFEPTRKAGLKKLMSKTPGVAIALDNCTALEIIDDKYRIITSKKSANGFITYWKNNEYIQKIISKNVFQNLKELIIT